MKVTVNEDGRTNIQCPNCNKIFHPHIINPRQKKIVNCIFCKHKFIVQGQKRHDIFVWIRTKFIHPLDKVKNERKRIYQTSKTFQ
jgi:hypothetical protein